MHKLVPFASLAALSFLTSCASIVSGTKQPIQFASEPSGAEIKIDGVGRARTPAELEVSTKKNHLVRLELAGYQPYETTLKRKLNGWIFGNLAFGGLIGVIVDASTGAIYGLTPDEVNAQLTSASRGRGRHSKAGDDTIYVGTVLKADPKWRKAGQLARQ